MSTNLYKHRKQQVRARSRDMRFGLGYQRFDALWRFASIPKHKRRAERASQLLARSKTLMQTDPGAYYRSPVGNRYEVEAEQALTI